MEIDKISIFPYIWESFITLVLIHVSLNTRFEIQTIEKLSNARM